MNIFLREKIFRKIWISKLSPFSNNILKKTDNSKNQTSDLWPWTETELWFRGTIYS